MKPNTYYLIENGEVLHHSASMEKIINYTTKTTNAIVIYNGCVIWKQRP